MWVIEHPSGSGQSGAGVSEDIPGFESRLGGFAPESGERERSGVAVRPFFFDADAHRLFGVYYEPPAAKRGADSPVLICPPIANEYVRSFNAIRKLCERLAERGFCVLKFDYYGLGDSFGESTEGEAGEWRANIRAAAHELCKRSGQKEITAVGLRLGATLAAGIRLDDGMALKNLVLWDPVVNGADYLAQLRCMHRSCLADTRRFRKPQSHRFADGEMVGFRFPAAMQESIAALTLLNKPLRHHNLFLVTSAQRPEYELLAGSLLHNARGRLTRELVDEPTNWDDGVHVESTLRINRTIATICDKISNGFI
jgi:uncharacterized protein